MARKTVRAVVDVVPNLRMLLVHRRLVMCVTGRAREHREIRRIRMAIGACGPLTLMGT